MAAIKIREPQDRGARDVTSPEAIRGIWSEAEETVREETPLRRARYIASRERSHA